MIVKNGTDPVIEARKRRLGLRGGVYIYNGHFMESLSSHKKLMTALGYTSTARTIEQAYDERVRVEEELEAKRLAEAEKAAQEAQETQEDISEDDEQIGGDE